MRGCVSFDEPTTILVIYMEMKPYKKSLGRNPRRVISKSGYGVKWARVGSSPLDDVSYLDLDTVLNE
jgi:hypothetical protein